MANLNGWSRGTWGQLEWGEGSIPLEITGVSATAILTSPGVNAQAVAAVAGITATLGAVSVTINADANATLTGLASTSALGTVATVTANIVEIYLSGATSSLGTATVDAEARVTITGVSATSTLGTLNIWSPINDSQNPNWTEIAA